MPNLTFVTPVASHHLPVLGRCIDSVKAQTVTTEHLIEIDAERLGPGAIRNKLLRQVTTPFVSFLDADDWLELDFAEKTLAAFRDRYIYTDWYQEEEIVQAPDCAWVNKTFHIVTAVVPTAWALEVGGFDEKLIGMEDTDFFVKLVTSGHCGRRLAVPLVHYRAKGGRAETIHRTGTIDALHQIMKQRYGGKKVGCCGGSGVASEYPVGERQPGDVLARALWGGNRAEYGRATGRRYPRTSWPHTTYVDPRDVKASPNLWEQVPEAQAPEAQPEQEEPKEGNGRKRGLDALEARMGLVQKVEPPKPQPVHKSREHVTYAPDFAKVKRLAGTGLRQNELYFVRPDREYPSYSDFWQLVALSGFSECSMMVAEKNLNNPSATLIFVTPDEIPDCTSATARCIFWQLEYSGEYTNQKNRQTCAEQWSSDPYHAARSSAQFVLLGSHPRLAPPIESKQTPRWDIITLSYLTDRRRTVYRLVNHEFAPDYPGHGGNWRDEQLRGSRVMLHVHQHDEPAIAPIKMALAAAYKLPVICEAVIDPGPYQDRVLFCQYESLPSMADLYLDGKIEMSYLPDALYQFLCVEHPFKACVLEALKAEREKVAA